MVYIIFQASLSNEKVFFESRSTDATHNTLSNIDCEVPNDWKNITSVTSAALFVTGFTVSVSNDGRHFSAGQPLYILDSICQDTINIDGNLEFIIKVHVKTEQLNVDHVCMSWKNIMSHLIVQFFCMKRFKLLVLVFSELMIYGFSSLQNLFQKSFCFIRGICVPNATVTGPNNCSVCISELNSFDWTVQYDRQGRYTIFHKIFI